MEFQFEYGDAVRVIRNIRNDGTYPGAKMGDLLIRRGSIGYVRDVGTFLQDQIIYTVHFLDDNCFIGCREEELISLDEPWSPSLYEFREKVKSKLALSSQGQVVVPVGAEGQVVKVVRDNPEKILYHVHFSDECQGRVFLVPETALDPVENPEESIPYTLS